MKLAVSVAFLALIASASAVYEFASCKACEEIFETNDHHSSDAFGLSLAHYKDSACKHSAQVDGVNESNCEWLIRAAIINEVYHNCNPTKDDKHTCCLKSSLCSAYGTGNAEQEMLAHPKNAAAKSA